MLLLIIRDGWGINNDGFGNAVQIAQPPYYNELINNYPRAILQACGEDVGLPAGQMGNSEVGHLNIGAGRIVYQDLLKISIEMKNGTFAKRPPIVEFLQKCQVKNKVHLFALISDGGVHSHIEHVEEFIRILAKHRIDEVYVHAFMDGRDTSPHGGLEYLKTLEKTLQANGKGKIATICGRYYAMDRDKRWDRLEKAYRCLVHGEGNYAANAQDCLEKSYAENITDEFILPTIIAKEGLIKAEDYVFFLNFRPDRAREITLALQNDNFTHFPVETLNLNYLTMTAYAQNIYFPSVYKKENLKQVLSQVIAEKGLKQFKTAETEKYAHVTYFLNGGREEPFPNEDRQLIPSPKVATYDLQPSMSAPEVTEALLAAIHKKEYALLVVNYANPDMVGHTGVLEAAVQAVQIVDDCVKKVTKACLQHGGTVLITADHGNLDEMIDPATKQPHTAHSLYPVDFILVHPEPKKYQLKATGRLADIAPTVLALMDIEQPAEMDGHSLLISKTDKTTLTDG